MAFEKTAFVKNIDWKKTRDDAPYITATVLQTDEDKTRQQSVFGDWVPFFVTAHKERLLLNYTIEKKEGERFWNVTYAELGGDALQDRSPEEQQESIDKGTRRMSADVEHDTEHQGDWQKDQPPTTSANPQAVGMCVKEIGELYRTRLPDGRSLLSQLMGQEATAEALKVYRQHLLWTLKIPYDGAKLPKMEVKDEGNS